jgi:carbonic anhydrase
MAEAMENYENPVTEQEFLTAWQVFAGDLELVHAGHLKPQSPFTKPPKPEYHNYHLTLPDRRELNKIKKVKIAGVTCKDWRVAEAAWNDMKNLGYTDDEILLISVAGGTVQDPPERQVAMKTMLKYIAQQAPDLKEVYLSGHTEGCAAVALWLHAPIADNEAGNMNDLVAYGVQTLAPEGKKVTPRLLTPDVDEHHHLHGVASNLVDLSHPRPPSSLK